jgi:thermitase
VQLLIELVSINQIYLLDSYRIGRGRMHKTFSGIILTLLLSGMLITAFIIQPVSSESSMPIEFPARGKHVPRFETLKEGEPNSTVRDEGNLNNGNERSEFNGDDKCSTQLVIRINNRISDAYTQLMGVIAKYDCEVVNTVSMAGEVIAVVVDVSSAEEPSLTREISADGLSSYIEHRMKVQAQFVPNDPYWSLQWGPQKIGADWAWNTTIGDPSVLVAVIDTGIDWDHPDLAANYVALGYDWVNNDPDPMDDNGHGTHCAGIIAAVINNSIGVAGLAQVRIMAEKGLDQYGNGYEDDLANAIIHAVDQGADILSLSWGSYGESALIHEAVKYAYDSGVLVVAAAGNDATNTRLYPAAYDEVIAVSATDAYDNPAYFTNFGEWVELAAPGVDIYSTYWDNTYRSMSGTSMSTPHVSGVAALVWSQFPNMTRDWIRAQLRYAADDLGAPGFDDYYGYGRINARKAVEQAPPDHDLLIFDWERPPLVKLGELATFNTTVLNFGISDETNVEIQLLVNSSLIDSTSIAFLPEGESATVGLSWTPTVEGTYNVTSYVVPVPEETITQNNLITEIITVVAPPPETNWILLATDPDEGVGTSLKAIYGQLYSDIIYFKVEHYRPWTTINDIDTAIFIDADQDPSTGLPDGFYPGQNTGIGADYVIVVGWQATKMWRWDPVAGMWDTRNPISLAYLEAPENSNAFVVGVFFDNVETPRIIDCAVADVQSNWDWMPDAGYFTLILIRYEHELTVFLEAPQHLQPGETSLLNATVYNVGLNNETNVELQLLINDTIVNNATIPELLSDSSYTLSYLWTPTIEGIYNVTAYAPPVPGENITTNNFASKNVPVRFVKYVLWDDVHDGDGDSLTGNYLLLYQLLSSSGFVVDELTSGTINSGVLAPYDILVLIDPEYDFLSSEISDIHDWVTSGGALIVIPDAGYPPTLNTVMAPYGVQLTGLDTGYGTTTNIAAHPITQDVESIYYDRAWQLAVSSPSEALAWTLEYYAFLSATTGGEVVVISDSNIMDNDGLGMADNTQLMLNIFNWIGVKYEHDLAVTLDAPTFLKPGDSSLLNATVTNKGLSNETDVELFLLINGSLVDSVVIPELLTGSSYTLSYLWTPTVEATYNVTAYAPLVPDENVTANNVVSKMIRVRHLPRLLVVDTPWPEDTGALDILGYEYTLVTPTEFATVDLYQYNVLFIGWEPGDTLVNALLARESEIADWVAAGNGIVALAEFDEANRWAWLPLWVSGSSGFHADTVHILNPAHPVMSGLTDAELSGWGISYHGYFISYHPAWEALAQGVEAAQPITLAATYGAGRIAITDQDPDYHLYYGYEEGAGKLLRNMIEWLLTTPVPPVASFTWTPSIPKVGEPVTFDASASTPNGGTIIKYEWNFGDGETATGKVVSHTYTNSGTYTVTLNVTDSEGLWDIEQKQTQVVQPHSPKAEFTATPETARLGENIKFDGSASLPGWNGTHIMPIIEYRWDFGDGNTTTTSTSIIYHSYKTARNYYVTLTVYAPGATPETDTITHRVTVISVPVGGYSFPIQVQTKTEPIITYIASLTIITMLFTKIKQKTKRKRISIG